MTRLLPQFSHSHSCPPNAGVLHLTLAFNALHCSTVNRCIFLYSDTNRRTIFAIIPASTSTLQFTTPALLFLQPKIVFFSRHSHPLAAGPQGASLNDQRTGAPLGVACSALLGFCFIEIEIAIEIGIGIGIDSVVWGFLLHRKTSLPQAAQSR